MTGEPIPLILVHGWKSHAGVWNRLLPRLDAAGITCSRFSYEQIAGEDIPVIAGALENHLRQYRRETGYAGQVDICAHSLGTCIVRYFLEVMDGKARREKVRQLIGLGPPNNGSSLAELFSDPELGPPIVHRLTGVFVPQGYDPTADRIVQNVRFGSPVMSELRSAGLRTDIAYRVIVTANPSGNPAFFPLFDGKTWERDTAGRYRLTSAGDGIVTNRESALQGIPLDIILPGADGPECPASPDQYCHISMPRNPAVIGRVMHYLTGT